MTDCRTYTRACYGTTCCTQSRNGSTRNGSGSRHPGRRGSAASQTEVAEYRIAGRRAHGFLAQQSWCNAEETLPDVYTLTGRLHVSTAEQSTCSYGQSGLKRKMAS
jgi:hypothetical protein